MRLEVLNDPLKQVQIGGFCIGFATASDLGEAIDDALFHVRLFPDGILPRASG